MTRGDDEDDEASGPETVGMQARRALYLTSHGTGRGDM